MDLLLDTHAFIWYVEDNKKLPKATRRIIEGKDNDLYISIAAFWEMSIKMQLGKLSIAKDLEATIEEAESLGFLTLPIEPSHIIKLHSLKLHHRDPFDRIIAAQALNDKMHLVSADDIFDSYKVKRVW
jgi:PIN domain nuclease of toxin-antitoxin system